MDHVTLTTPNQGTVGHLKVSASSGQSVHNAAQRVWGGLGRNKIVRVGKKSGPVLSRLWTKVHETLVQRRRPFILFNAIARLSMSVNFFSFCRYSPLGLQVVEKRTNAKVFRSNYINGGSIPTVLRHIASAIYRPPFGKVQLSFVCWSPFAKPGTEVECRI